MTLFWSRIFVLLSHFIAVCTMHIMKYVLYIFIIYSLVGGAECLLHLFVYCIVSTVLCCTVLYAVQCVWIIFGYVWVYYVISPVDIECEWLQINSEIANQLCPSLRIKMTVSKLDLYCACSILSHTHTLSLNVCVYIVFLDGITVYMPNIISIQLVAIFCAHTCMLMKIPLQMLHFLRSNL